MNREDETGLASEMAETKKASQETVHVMLRIIRYASWSPGEYLRDTTTTQQWLLSRSEHCPQQT
jgi:hypothetical protein